MTTRFEPPFLSPQADKTLSTTLCQALQGPGYAVLNAQGVAAQSNCAIAQLQNLNVYWQNLPADAYLKDGGRYRRRRHSCFVVEGGQQGEQVRAVPHRAHWQPLEYNALHGGMQRWFEPMPEPMVGTAVWTQLLLWLGRVASQCLAGTLSADTTVPWFVEAHQFRIDTTDGIGRPTPEGAHRDGVDLVAVFLIDRVGIKGGETRVFDAAGPSGQRFTLSESWSLLLLDDAKVIHETTPIQPVAEQGWRDTLVVTLRRGGFQGTA